LRNNEQLRLAGIATCLINGRPEGDPKQLSRAGMKIDRLNIAEPAGTEFGFDAENRKNLRDPGLEPERFRSRRTLRLFLYDPESNAESLQLEGQHQADRAGADDQHFALMVHRAISP
jgi:hypothetical protein